LTFISSRTKVSPLVNPSDYIVSSVEKEMTMKHLVLRVLAPFLVVCLLASAPVQAQNGAPASLNGFDGFVEQVMKDWHVPGLAVAIVKDGRVVYAKGYGYRDVKKGLKVTPDTLFAIGSCSKSFTATSLAILASEGKLDWDKPLRDYLPDFRLYDGYATAQLRPRDLVTHQSGLPRHDLVWYGSPLSRKELFDRLRYLEPSKPLHAKYQYNNLMFMTAGVLIERISGNTWEEFVRRRILDPLGMKATNFSVNDSQKTSDFSLPYQELNGEVKEIPFRNIDAIGPAGSINSSVNEMTHWLLLQLSKGKFEGRQIVAEKNLAEVHTPQIVAGGDLKYDESFYSSYAMGWAVTSYRGHPAVAHSGGIDGFTSAVRFLPKDQLGVVVLTNSSSPASGLISSNAVDRMLGLSEAPWAQRALDDMAKAKQTQAKAKADDEAKRKKDAQPTHKLSDYTGQFEHPAYQTLTISQEGEQLKFELHGLTGGLKHYHYDVFQGTEGSAGLEGTKLTFIVNPAGEIDSVVIPLEPSVKEIIFKRKPKTEEKASAQK
jgi:CubicO group peptidase (beta-lactamase class C family)